MLAVLCSIIANTAPDGDGKQAVYRRNTRGSVRGGKGDPTLMRPEDFLPDFMDVPNRAAEDAAAVHGQVEEFLGKLVESGAVDARKRRRDGPRNT